MLSNSWKGKILHTVTDSSHSRGICVLFRDDLKLEVLDYKCCTEEMLINVMIWDEVYCLTNIMHQILKLTEIIFSQTFKECCIFILFISHK